MNAEVEIRTAQVADVSFPDRTIELIVMPYETETTIREQGREFTEIVTRGAFDGLEAKNGGQMRVSVNRDHEIQRTVGRAMAFHPTRQEGLVADLRISATALGEETLVLADDGVLGASAGFTLLRKHGRYGPVVPGAETWETRQRRRLNRLYLAHIALTPDPAYVEANVLAVRQGIKSMTEVMADERLEPAPSMPNRDRFMLEQWRRQLADIDARYSHR
jgi:phage head maturation protease